MIADLPDALQRNKEILDEADRILKEEKDSDDQVGYFYSQKYPFLHSLNLLKLRKYSLLVYSSFEVNLEANGTEPSLKN